MYADDTYLIVPASARTTVRDELHHIFVWAATQCKKVKRADPTQASWARTACSYPGCGTCFYREGARRYATRRSKCIHSHHWGPRGLFTIAICTRDTKVPWSSTKGSS